MGRACSGVMSALAAKMAFLNSIEYEPCLESDAAVGNIDPGGAERVLFSTKRLGVRVRRLLSIGPWADEGVEANLGIASNPGTGGVGIGVGGNGRS